MQAQIERSIIDCVVNGAGLPTGSTQTDVRAPVLADSTQTISGTKTFSGTLTLSGATTLSGSITKAGRKKMMQRAKVGATAGGVVNAADNKNSAARVPQSQTASTLVFIVEGIPQGATVTAIAVIGQVESAGGAVTVDAALRKQTAAAADLTDAAVTNGAITQVSVTADTALSAANAGVTGIAEVIGDDETLYVLVTVTTAASTDVDLQGILVTFTEVI